ncbi:MAG: PD40 domain-containing protein [Bacteroidales bacterium]|nr:PD40 domain-containing protein [Bacteroidales bacterium]
MKMGKRILFLVIVAVLSGHLAVAQTDSLMRYGDSLHRAYDFAEAESVYLQVLDSLDVVADSLMVKDVRERLRMSENGKNMSRFVQVPQAAGKRRLPQEAFFLAYPLEDRSWRALPNVLDADSGHEFVKSLYAPDWNDALYYSAEGPSGTRDIMMTMLDDTVWTVPVPVSELSDPSADEIYPMLSPDGKTMYFASDGLYGVGGYDLYKSVWDEQRQRWSSPQNMGFPYSSPADDFLYVESEDGDYALFASNRECGKDSVYVYAIRYEDYPVHTPMTDPYELQELALVNPPIVEAQEETVADIPDNDLTIKYMAKMDEVRVLRDSIASTSSSLETLRNEYVFGNDPAERARLTNEILQLETRIPSLQRALDKASTELGSIEMEFLKEGIFLNMDMQKEDEAPVADMPEYDFRMRSMGDSLAIAVLVPEVKFDYSFRIEPEAVFAEDQTIPGGIVYQVQLFSGGRKATLSELKGLTPIYEHRTPSGLYIYRAGVFGAYQEAVAAAEQIRRRGFRDAYITAFIDGKEVSVVSARTEEANRNNQVLMYEVRIIPESGELESEVVEGMVRMAMGKDIARIEAEDGTQVFIVGPFDNKAMAEELASYVRGKITGKVSCELLGNELDVD